MSTVNEERVELFAAALESGKYEQCAGKMKIGSFDPSGLRWIIRFCALGVATEVALQNGLQVPRVVNDPWDNDPWDIDPWRGGTLCEEVMDWYGFSSQDPRVFDDSKVATISWYNDNGWSFWNLAQLIRATFLKDKG